MPAASSGQGARKEARTQAAPSGRDRKPPAGRRVPAAPPAKQRNQRARTTPPVRQRGQGARTAPSAPRRGRPAGGQRRSWRSRLLRGLAVGAAALAVAGFCVLLYRLTLTPRPASSPYITDNTEPGETLRRYLDRPSVRAAIREIGGNFVLFMPLGALLPVVARSLSGPLRIVLLAAALSFGIETVQGTLVTGRSFDADDVILNTSGALLAYLVIGRRLARWSD